MQKGGEKGKVSHSYDPPSPQLLPICTWTNSKKGMKRMIRTIKEMYRKKTRTGKKRERGISGLCDLLLGCVLRTRLPQT